MNLAHLSFQTGAKKHLVLAWLPFAKVRMSPAFSWGMFLKPTFLKGCRILSRVMTKVRRRCFRPLPLKPRAFKTPAQNLKAPHQYPRHEAGTHPVYRKKFKYLPEQAPKSEQPSQRCFLDPKVCKRTAQSHRKWPKRRSCYILLVRRLGEPWPWAVVENRAQRLTAPLAGRLLLGSELGDGSFQTSVQQRDRSSPRLGHDFPYT